MRIYIIILSIIAVGMIVYIMANSRRKKNEQIIHDLLVTAAGTCLGIVLGLMGGQWQSADDDYRNIRGLINSSLVFNQQAIDRIVYTFDIAFAAKLEGNSQMTHKQINFTEELKDYNLSYVYFNEKIFDYPESCSVIPAEVYRNLYEANEFMKEDIDMFNKNKRYHDYKHIKLDMYYQKAVLTCALISLNNSHNRKLVVGMIDTMREYCTTIRYELMSDKADEVEISESIFDGFVNVEKQKLKMPD